MHSIKTENKFIYGLIQKVRECIQNETPQIEFHLKFFDPLTDFDLVDFSLGPHKVNLPPEEDDPDDYFNSSQLYFIMTDLSNLTPQFIQNSNPKSLEFAYAVNHFVFRIKNNDIGLLKMFPSSWIDFNKSQVERILAPIQTEDGAICVRDICMVLTLWRYPTPGETD